MKYTTPPFLLALLIAGCDGQPVPERASVEQGALEGEPAAPEEPPLTPALLELENEGEIQAVVTGRLSVDEPTAGAWAMGYAEREMGYQGPLSVRAALPVEDSRGVLISRHFVLSTVAGPQSPAALASEFASILEGVDPRDGRSAFRQIHEATARDYVSITVAAYRFRHPLRRAHRGVPRWLAERGEADEACQGAATAEAILPASGAPGALEVVRYRCPSGEELLWSHYTDRALSPGELHTRHRPAMVFRRWAHRVRTAYSDPAARVAFTEGLWDQFLQDQGEEVSR